MAELSSTCSTLSAPTPGREEPMIREALWQEIHRLFTVERWSKAAIARTLDLDRKTVRTCLAQLAWTAYQRPPRADTLLAAHQVFLAARAPAVGYSAQVLYQELRQHHLDGILAWTKLRVTNGALEGMNNKVKAISHRAFGFRTTWTYIANIYRCCAALPLP
jgi:hypothetical protein